MTNLPPGISYETPDWIKAMDPSPSQATAVGKVADGVEVEARWWYETIAERTTGPRQVVITLTDDMSPQAFARGINSGVMRRVEPILASLLTALDKQPEPERDLYWEHLSDRARALPDSPRSRTGDYYADLLDLYEFMEVTHPQPVVDLQRLLTENGRSVTKETLNKQLQRARQRRSQGGTS